jgi:hypothetical protein
MTHLVKLEIENVSFNHHFKNRVSYHSPISYLIDWGPDEKQFVTTTLLMNALRS